MPDPDYTAALQDYMRAQPPDEGMAGPLRRYMTHEAERPNPAAPYVDMIRERFQPLDFAPVHLPGSRPQDYLRELRDPYIMAKSIEQAGNFNFLGSTKGPGITAYHGSPYDFERFDLSKIGTGEGAQAYGRGLYFAENEGVAKGYRDQLSGRPKLMEGPEKHAAGALKSFQGDRTIAERDLRTTAQNMRDLGGDGVNEFDHAADLLAKGWQPSKGKMYQVAIKTDPEHFLDWDKPLSEQPHVQEKLQQLSESGTAPMHKMIKEALSKDLTTGETIANIAGKGEHTMSALREAGIPGIKYLDQASRFAANQSVPHLQNQISQLEDMLKASPHREDIQGALAQRRAELKTAQSGTRNYVVFDDKMIDILKKYGLAGLIAGGAAHYSDRDGNRHE